jgi:hypothetical protein
VGFNMSWVLVDGIKEDALYEALDLAATDETPDPHDLGTSYVPLAGAALKSGGGRCIREVRLGHGRDCGDEPAAAYAAAG